MLLIKVLTELLSTGIFTISSSNIPEYLPYFLDPSKYLIEYYQILYSMSRYWIMDLKKVHIRPPVEHWICMRSQKHCMTMALTAISALIMEE